MGAENLLVQVGGLACCGIVIPVYGRALSLARISAQSDWLSLAVRSPATPCWRGGGRAESHSRDSPHAAALYSGCYDRATRTRVVLMWPKSTHLLEDGQYTPSKLHSSRLQDYSSSFLGGCLAGGECGVQETVVTSI